MVKIKGIDLAGMEKNETGICVLEGKTANTKILHSDTEILTKIAKENPHLICINKKSWRP